MKNNLTSQIKKTKFVTGGVSWLMLTKGKQTPRLFALPVLYLSPYIVILFSSLYEIVSEGC